MLLLRALGSALYYFCASLLISVVVLGCVGGLFKSIAIDPYKLSAADARRKEEPFLLIALACAGIFVIVRTASGFATPFMEQSRERLAELRRQQDEQRTCCNQVVTICEESGQVLTNLSGWLAAAERSLRQAEVDFAEHALSPFWSSIESAATGLAHANAAISDLSARSARYGELIVRYVGRTAPRFPLSPQSVDKLRAVALAVTERMQIVVRRAQCDPGFAMIYEQRRTNAILIAGFSNLAQALEHMTERVTSSLVGLAHAVERMNSTVAVSAYSIKERLIDLEDLVSRASSAQAAREEEALRLLDRIPRGRR